MFFIAPNRHQFFHMTTILFVPSMGTGPRPRRRQGTANLERRLIQAE